MVGSFHGVLGLGFRVWGLGFRVQGLGSGKVREASAASRIKGGVHAPQPQPLNPEQAEKFS